MASNQQNTQAVVCSRYEEHHRPCLTPVAAVRENAEGTQSPVHAAPGPETTRPAGSLPTPTSHSRHPHVDPLPHTPPGFKTRGMHTLGQFRGCVGNIAEFSAVFRPYK